MADGQHPTQSILVVDDDDAIRDGLARILEAEGYSVSRAANGREALDILRRGGPPGLILLDLVMPIMNGWQFRDEQLRDPALASVPVVVLSSADAVQQHADSIGIAVSLEKPVDVNQLITTVHGYCPSPREAIRRSEDRYRLLMENVREYAIFFLDQAGRVVDWNVGAERILGYAEVEIVGQHFACIYTPEDVLGRAPEHELRTAAAEGRSQDERWHVRKDGGRFWASGMVMSLRDDSGQLHGFAKVLRDLTEQKRADEELRRAKEAAEAANRSKDVLLAMVAHDLRGPLTPILSAAHVLRKNLADQALTGMVERIERSARMLAQLIADLMDISRIVTGKLHLEACALDLPPVLDAAIEMVRSEAEAKAIVLHRELDPAVGQVRADPNRIQQVVWNLLSNALKFTPPGGRVEVRLTRVEGRARITVSDTGSGIEADILPHVFERFLQAEHTGSHSQGLGLGLAIVRHMVELHGGTVRAESRGAGQGATFTVDLPLLSAAAREESRIESSDIRPSGTRSAGNSG